MGKPVFTACPMLSLTEDVYDMLRLLDLSDENAWPVNTGTLGQTSCFMKCREFVATESRAIAEEMKSKRNG